MQSIEQRACFGGQQEVWQHTSSTLGCEMRFAVYLPPQARPGAKLPVLYWLSGLTCT
ncbi:alpha/beta hydrolase-fold protein, partial [Burkholderia sp. SIMBA_024]|uniref:alpha/beta hydrolase-fold protein n=1 Tax=Burkholderia sp. SIMBA_024 TaxID=3085768 RepID=UPI00397D6332